MIDRSKFSDYDKVVPYGMTRKLPKGGYVLVIKGAEICQNSRGEYVKILCDVAEGDCKGFFLSDFTQQPPESRKWHCNYLLSIPNDDGSEQDSWTKRKFKTFTNALEESNEGYHFDWDERKFKGKRIGGIFNEREYMGNDNKSHMATNLALMCSVENIRSGNFQIPEDKMLSERKSPAQADAPAQNDGQWMEIPDGDDLELPF